MRRAAAVVAAAGLSAGLVAAVLAAGPGDGREAPPQAAAAAWSRWPAARVARTEVAAGPAGGHAYVIGGMAAPDGGATAAVERLNLRTRRWSRGPSLPAGVHHAAAAAWRGSVYVVGGYRASGSLTAETGAVYRLAPGARRWQRLPAMPTPRGALAAAVAGDRLYAIGGAAGGRALRAVEVFDLRRRRWHRGPALRVAREHLAAAVAGGRVYAIAGRAPGNLAVVERLERGGRGWRRVRSVRKARSGHAAATVRGRIVVVGGEEAAGTIREVELLDGGRWRRLSDLRTPRHGLGAVAAGDRVLALAGGVRPGLTFSRAAEALRVSAR